MEMHFPILLDGATGTELQKRGFTGDMATEKWVLENPNAIIDVQQAYIAAGSNIVYAPTFSANAIKLEENGIYNKVSEYNRELVALSKSAAEGKAWVAGDISPTGKFLAPVGDMSFEDLYQIYLEQVTALEEGGADLYVVETMMTVSDARAAVLAIRSVSKKPIFVTFTCDANGKTLFGSDIVAVLQIMQGLGVDAFGMNCSVGPEDMLKQVNRLYEYSDVPIIAKPNAGLPERIGGKTVYNCPPEEFAASVKAFADAGVCIFGGCCGTSPDHISAVKAKLADINLNLPSPKHRDKLPVASEKNIFMLNPDVTCSRVLDCDVNLSECLEDMDDLQSQVLGIKLKDDSCLDDLAEAQTLLDCPVCFCCEDARLLENALRIYQGRPMYQGSLPEDVLRSLRDRYGLIY